MQNTLNRDLDITWLFPSEKHRIGRELALKLLDMSHNDCMALSKNDLDKLLNSILPQHIKSSLPCLKRNRTKAWLILLSKPILVSIVVLSFAHFRFGISSMSLIFLCAALTLLFFAIFDTINDTASLNLFWIKTDVDRITSSSDILNLIEKFILEDDLRYH